MSSNIKARSSTHVRGARVIDVNGVEEKIGSVVFSTGNYKPGKKVKCLELSAAQVRGARGHFSRAAPHLCVFAVLSLITATNVIVFFTYCSLL